jgi:Dyp-type peroxidase family
LLELGNIQAGVLHPRPTPYAGTYIGFRIDDQIAGRGLLKRLIPLIKSAADVTSPVADAGLSLALSYQGLRALGVPQESLDSFSPEFKQGMAARAEELRDVGKSAPEHWERPLGTSDLHLMLAIVAGDDAHLASLLQRAEPVYREIRGVTAIYRQDAHALPTEKEPFGFRDGTSQPAVEGSGVPGSNPQEIPVKAGEFVLGYLDEKGSMPRMPQPEVLGRNGCYVAYRKLYEDVAAFRRYLAQNSASLDEQELLAAKMMGRWRSGAPLALCPVHDDPELGADPKRRNNFLYLDDDPQGFKTPLGSHIRRMNPRDQFKDGLIQVNRHRVIRRGTVYGSALPEGVLEDDGVDRGILFVFLGADLNRQFEFVQREWINQGLFIGAPTEKDPITGPNDGTGVFTIPKQPIRQRRKGVPQFVINRGGEYFFLPGLPALRWLADRPT